jgi:thioredoxin-dependent peroxiredoxin
VTAYDVAGDRNGVKYAKRVTYVIESGKIAQVYETVNTETHASDILAAIG